MPPAKTGYQPRNTPAERRAFFDTDRQIEALLQRVVAAEAKLADHEARLVVLEP
jgi:hypothetical protein